MTHRPVRPSALGQDWNSYPNLTHTKSTLSQALGFRLGCGRQVPLQVKVEKTLA